MFQLGKREKYYRRIAWQAEGRNSGMAIFAEKKNLVSSRQRAVPHVSGWYDENLQTTI